MRLPGRWRLPGVRRIREKGSGVDFAAPACSAAPLIRVPRNRLPTPLPGTLEQCRADADHRGPFFDGDFEVAAHAHRELVELHVGRGDTAEAVAQLAQVGEVPPRDGGIAFQRRGQLDDAQAAFEDALEVARWQGAKLFEARARAARTPARPAPTNLKTP